MKGLALYSMSIGISVQHWFISHQPAVLFSQNKSAIAISHQPNEQTASFFNQILDLDPQNHQNHIPKQEFRLKDKRTW
jgi:hypothetical protein